ncbi:MAG: PepSY-associated TM helix domain-containing protein [Imperialibacter sp.]|uniref:PepSY-associated TM helix domain-containing protein n=1 Tax=Imperialibacter sp. TaxID=2038411 RepID=UPI0032ED2F8A
MSNSENNTSRKAQAKVLRVFRKVHRLTGAFLFVFFFIVSISGLLLGWKKHSGDLILAKTRTGQSADPQEWKSINEITLIAQAYLLDSIDASLSPAIDRLDIRQDKGIVKVLFADHYKSFQIDCTTGEVLHTETRLSDLIEHIHDGSIIDDTFGWQKGLFKLAYTTVTGLALLVFTITGFWLWYGPKVMRKQTNKVLV